MPDGAPETPGSKTDGREGEGQATGSEGGVAPGSLEPPGTQEPVGGAAPEAPPVTVPTEPTEPKPPTTNPAPLPTFTGFGDETPGGIGGALVRVTTLASSGPGSFSEAIALAGPRVIVFEVGGIIDLNLARLQIREPFVTIAGQTAPSPGITLIRGGLIVATHDVRIQHLRVRMGDAGTAPASGFEPDVTTDGADAHDIVFDHVSVAWGVDENLSVSGPRFDGPAGTSHSVTIKNSIIAEGLNESVHVKGSHSMGTLIHDYASDIAVLGNLYAHNNERNPWFKAFATGVIVNNVVYDPGIWAMRLGAVINEWAESGIVPEGPRVSIVGNVLRQGPSTPADSAMVDSNSNGSAYLEDNRAFDVQGAPARLVGPTITQLAEKPSWPIGLMALPADAVFEHVLRSAGARPNERDAVDERLVAEVRAGTGRIIDSQNEVGGYPVAEATERALQVPEDVGTWLAELARQLESLDDDR
jgi:hypothetical protein